MKRKRDFQKDDEIGANTSATEASARLGRLFASPSFLLSTLTPDKAAKLSIAKEAADAKSKSPKFELKSKWTALFEAFLLVRIDMMHPFFHLCPLF